MNPRMVRGLALVTTSVLAASAGLLLRSQQGDAATGSVVLCADRKGSVVVRSACRRGERALPIAPASARSIDLPPLTVPLVAAGGSPDKSSARRAAPAANAVVETVSLLAETPRTYTRRIRFATGSPISGSVSSSVDTSDPYDRWNQTAVLPNCPRDVPVILERSFALQPEPTNGLRSVEVETGRHWQLVNGEGSDQIYITLDDSLLDNRLEIFDGADDGLENLWFDLDVFVSVTCAPITALTVSP